MDTDHQADKAWLLDIQRRLYTWSRTHPDDGWREMWNWVTHPDNLRQAWRRVESNRGARSAGVDRFLADLRSKLRLGSYRPSPVRRVLIPKRGKPGQFRPLGVPTVEDRVVQAALLHLLEPIFEAGFQTVSYGFRPRRSCRDALEHIRVAVACRLDRPRHPDRPISGSSKGTSRGASTTSTTTASWSACDGASTM